MAIVQKLTVEGPDTKRNIFIKGARLHNLKNIDVVIPRNKFVVITGLSGSGKSTLAFDTLFAEGQRRYVESLSAYARQFLGRMNKPDVDFIKGISPAIAIQQKVTTRNPRSTVGTSTEIYDYLKLLFARIGKTYSPVSGNEVRRHNASDVVNSISSLPAGSKVLLLSPIPALKRNERLSLLAQQGFSRVLAGEDVVTIEDALKQKKNSKGELFLVVDRLIIEKDTDEQRARIADSVQTAFFEGGGACFTGRIPGGPGKIKLAAFSNKFELDGMNFEEPDVNFFSFNNPVGACKKCEGFGSIIGIDEDLVIPNTLLSVYEDAVACWKGDVMSEWKKEVLKHAHKTDFPVHKPYKDLPAKFKKMLWDGNKDFSGIHDFFRMLENNLYKIQYRVLLSRYRGKTVCPDCHGTRLREDASYVKVSGMSIHQLVTQPVSSLLEFFSHLQLSGHDLQVGRRILTEIRSRCQFLTDVGLGYLTLNRLSNSLSGGESQRINLATSLGSSLVGSMYILDEPSIGLHPRDTKRLIGVLKKLRDIGSTVIVVEHDEEVMRASDHIIDIGPGAGSFGGSVVYQGPVEKIHCENNSLTAQYLTGSKRIDVPARRRKVNSAISIRGAAENNLKNIDVKIPLHCLTVITGVSGSGKSSLVKKILYPALKKMISGYADRPGKHSSIGGSLSDVTAVEFVDQNPIGKSSRSNPVTYVKAYDEIRALYAAQPLSKLRGYKSSHFSFNVDGGRCDVCDGEGEVIIEMQFMADIHLPCDACGGKRFKMDVLEVLFEEKNIADLLSITVDDAVSFFRGIPSESAFGSQCKRIAERLGPLQSTGLGYVTLGQSSSTLSGGEAQRIKLASFIGMGPTASPTLFIFDEPTTGLHYHDIRKLLDSLEVLIEQGHSVLIIEHNLEVIKCADWIVDLGPEGGDEGGYLIFAGTPEDLITCKESETGKFLREKL